MALDLRRLQGRALYRTMSAACGAAFMLYGYDAGVLGGFQETPEFRQAIGNPEGPYIVPIVASIYNLGAGVMALCTTFFGMQLGRKRTILLGHGLVFLGTVIQVTTFSVGQIVAGRIITGAGIGCVSSAVPMYMAEMSLEAKERGPELQYQLALLITGVAIAYWIDLAFVQGLEENPWLWRVPLAMQCCFSAFSSALLAYLPDTPRWYYAKDRHEEADDVLSRLHELPIQHEKVQTMKTSILNTIREEAEMSNDTFNWFLLFWDNSQLQIGRRLRTSFIILWTQQFLGINMLVYYSTQIFSNLGYSFLLSGILAAAMNTIFAAACFPPMWYIERIGRRPMMIWCAIGCGICMIIYVVLTTLPMPGVAVNWTAVAFIILYVVIFAFGWQGTCWVYGPEIAPLRYRHIAGGLGAAGEWFSTWIMVFGGGSGINAVGPMIFVWPLLCCFLGAAYVWYYCPETTGRTLEEIDALFAKPGAQISLESQNTGHNLPAIETRNAKGDTLSEPKALTQAWHYEN